MPQFVHCQDAVPVEIEVAEETGVDFAAFRANGQSQRRAQLVIDERSKFLLRDLAVGRVDVDVFPTRLRSARHLLGEGRQERAELLFFERSVVI